MRQRKGLFLTENIEDVCFFWSHTCVVKGVVYSESSGFQGIFTCSLVISLRVEISKSDVFTFTDTWLLPPPGSLLRW